MDKIVNFFKEMGITTQIILIIISLFLVFSFIYRLKFNSYKPNLGVFAGYFCIPQPEGDKQILKNFHISPLFVSRCESGRFEIDSDLDGLCDSDETEKGSSPSERFSKHPAISDSVWWQLSVQQKSRIDSLAKACNTGDQDADLLTNCEEQVLTSNIYEASNSEQTKALYQLNSLNINHPDTDEDGYVDGIEVRFLNIRAPFIFSNEEIGISSAEKILSRWQEQPKGASVEIIVRQTGDKSFCYEYELKNFELWISAINGFNRLTRQKGPVKLDFLIYGLTSSESEPEKAAYYGAKVIAVNFFEGRFIEKALDEPLNFSRIVGGTK